MPPYNINSFFEPSGNLTTVTDPGSPLGIPTGNAMGGQDQLLALLGGGMKFQQKMALEKMKQMQQAAKMAQMESQLRQEQGRFGLQQSIQEANRNRRMAPSNDMGAGMWTKQVPGGPMMGNSRISSGAGPGAQFAGHAAGNQGPTQEEMIMEGLKGYGREPKQLQGGMQLQSLAEMNYNRQGENTHGGGNEQADWHMLNQLLPSKGKK